MIYNEIYNYLLARSWARERKNRKEVILEILWDKWAHNENSISKGRAKNFADDWVSYDRIFRLVQQENEELRGKDYLDGSALSEAKQIELGYEVGYHQANKRLQKQLYEN